MLRTYGEATYETREGMFAAGNLVRANNVLCPDGIRRNAFPTYDGIADTFYSVPAFVYARHEGKTVRVYGYVTIDNDDVRFVPYTYRKHASVVCHPLPDVILCKHCGNEVHEVRNSGALAHYVHTATGVFLCSVEGYRNGTQTTHAETDDVPTAYVPRTS